MPPVPRGGTKTPLNPLAVSYQFGTQPGQAPYYPGGDKRLYGVADLHAWQQARDAFMPDEGAGGSGIFAPNYPPVPWGPEALRTWDYEVGRNLIWTPRPYEAINFADLEALAQWHDITRLAIETRKDQIEKLKWSIRPRDEKKAGKDGNARAGKLMDLFARPEADREKDFASWLRENIDQVLVTDAPALEIRRNRGGDVIGFDIVKGTSLVRLIDHTGRTPEPPIPYLLQTIHGRPWKLLGKDVVLYRPRNLRPGKLYGMSPVEQIVTTVNIALRRQFQQLDYFTESNIPVGLIAGPSDWTPDQIAGFQRWFDNLLAGNVAERTKLIWGPAGSRYIPFKEPPIKDEQDEWFARVVCFAFSLPPNAFVKQLNRAQSETLKESALEEGLAPLMGWVERLLNYLIQVVLAQPDLEFAWDLEEAQDPADEAHIYQTYIDAGVMRRNEARDKLGFDPDPDGDVLTVKSSEGATPLTAIINPPEPPPPIVMAHPGAVGPDGKPLPAPPAVPGAKPAVPAVPGQKKPAVTAPANANAKQPAPTKPQKPAATVEPTDKPKPKNAALLYKATTPRTLCVIRPILNRDDIEAWAQRQGFPSVVSDPHVTIAYSKAPLSWEIAGSPDESTHIMAISTERSVEALGDKGAVVLRFESDVLHNRWQEFLLSGASWDYPQYRPHVTITYDPGGLLGQLDEVAPYYGQLVFGPEEWREIDPGWLDELEEEPTAAIVDQRDPTPTDKITQAEAAYTFPWNGVDQCQRCTMFHAQGTCDLVEGNIDGRAHCKFYDLSATALANDRSKAARRRELVHAEAVGLLSGRRDRGLSKRLDALEREKPAQPQPINVTIPVTVDARQPERMTRTVAKVSRNPDGSLAVEGLAEPAHE